MPAADGLDALQDRQLRSLATEWEVPTDGSRERLIERLRAVGATSPQARQEQAPQANPQTVRAAYDQLAGPGEWVSIADLRDRFPNVPREDMDALLRELEQQPDVNIVPQANEKALSERARGAAVTIGRQAKHFIAMGLGEEPPARGRAAQRLRGNPKV